MKRPTDCFQLIGEKYFNKIDKKLNSIARICYGNMKVEDSLTTSESENVLNDQLFPNNISNILKRNKLWEK